MTEARLRVLVAARWYPSHDALGRGSFIADQVRALERVGIQVAVASWEQALIGSPADADKVAERWARSIDSASRALATPRSWGAGVPVARLPAVTPADPVDRRPVDMARWQATTLVRFGERLMDVWPFDVIHAHTGLPDGVAAVTLADRLGVPLLTTEHDGSLDQHLADERSRTAYRTLVGERRGLVAVSGRLGDQAAELSGLPRSSISVIPNLIDRSLFRPDPSEARDPNELLWVGNRKPSKGMAELLDAFALLARERPGLRLRMIGDAPTEEDDARLRAQAVELGIAGRVRFEPGVPRSAVAAAMARAGLFVHPSPSESFGVVAIEALACGLPVVARAPTIRDLLGADGTLGEEAPGADGASLAEAIDRALGRLDSFDTDRLVAATKPFDETEVANRIVAAYRDLGAQAGGRHASGSLTDDRAKAAAVRALVVAARRRSAVDRVGRLPSTAAESLTVVTAPPSHPEERPPAGAWLEVDADAPWRERMTQLGALPAGSARPSLPARLLRAVSHPLRTMERRRVHASRSELSAETRGRAVSDAARALGPNAPVIALDAEDVAIVDRAGLGDRLAPGMLRWFADLDDERKGETEPGVDLPR